MHFAPSPSSRSPRSCETSFPISSTTISPKYFNAPCNAWKSDFKFFFYLNVSIFYHILSYALSFAFMFTSNFSYLFVSAPQINEYRMMYRGAACVTKEAFKMPMMGGAVEAAGDGKHYRTRCSISVVLHFMKLVHNSTSCVVTL